MKRKQDISRLYSKVRTAHQKGNEEKAYIEEQQYRKTALHPAENIVALRMHEQCKAQKQCENEEF